MKKVFKLIILVIVVSYFYHCENEICKSGSKNIADKFEVHFQHHFNDTHVFMKIDDHQIFSGDLQTDYTIGLAATIAPQIENGIHQLVLYIDGTQLDTTFNLVDTLVIGVEYFKDEEDILLHYYEKPYFPIYE